MSSRQTHFCRAPFERFEISSNGDVFLCCAGWVKGPAGNLTRQTLAEIWHGEKAQALRTSVTNGTFDLCSSQMCPHLQAIDSGTKLPRYSPIESFASPSVPRAAQFAKGEVPKGPLEVNTVFDLTCNLSCPSCRKEPIGLRPGTAAFQQAEKIADEVIEHLGHIRRLKVAGNGDPFASRNYWKILTSIDRDIHPGLRVMLHTNGILFTPERWKELHKAHGLIDTVEVAIDAASGESYALNRRGGSFETLSDRLNFIAKLRAENVVRRLLVSFVVQANNFHEMPAFIELARSVKADTTIFSRLNDWGSLPAANFAARAIHRPEHPKHAEFLAVLENPIFSDSDVFIGNLSEFRPGVGASGPVL